LTRKLIVIDKADTEYLECAIRNIKDHGFGLLERTEGSHPRFLKLSLRGMEP
jgi:hypothetical protein